MKPLSEAKVEILFLVAKENYDRASNSQNMNSAVIICLLTDCLFRKSAELLVVPRKWKTIRVVFIRQHQLQKKIKKKKSAITRDMIPRDGSNLPCFVYMVH